MRPWQFAAFRSLMRMSIALTLLSCIGAAYADEAPAQKLALPDGVRLILKPEPTSRSVAVSVFVRTPRDSTPQQRAIGDLVAHALWYGSQDRTDEWVAYSVDQAGGFLSTLRTPDYVAFSFVTSPSRLDEAAETLAEALKHADFTQKALDRARQDVLDSRRFRDENGFNYASTRVEALLSGQEEVRDAVMETVTQPQAQAYFRARYLPAQTVICVVGNFAPSAAQTDFEAYLDDYNRRSSQVADFAEPDETALSSEPDEEVPIAGSAAYALIACPAPRVDNPDYPAYVVLRSLLGGGHASRLFRRLRDRSGLGYGVGASLRSDLAAPLIAYIQWDLHRQTVEAAPPSLKPAEALKHLNKQLDAILTDPPAETEIARARNMAIGQDALRHERVRDRAFLMGWYEAMGLGYDFDAEMPRRLAGVSREDLLRIARKYLARRASLVAVPAKPQ